MTNEWRRPGSFYVIYFQEMGGFSVGMRRVILITRGVGMIFYPVSFHIRSFHFNLHCLCQ